MNRHRYAVVALGIAILGFAAAMLLWPKPHVVTSDDGLVTLEIARGALPEGVSLEDISIAKEAIANVFDVPGNTQALPAYKLSPDGLVLSKPAKVTFTSPLDASQKSIVVPLMVHKSAQGAEVLSSTAIDLSEDGKTFALSGEISHFSWVVIVDGIFEMKIEPYSVTLPVGQTVPVSVSIRHRPSTTIRDGRAIFVVAPGTSWRVNGDNNKHFMLETGGKMSPAKMNLPTREIKESEGAYRVEETYTCNRPGYATLTLRDNIVIDYTLMRVNPRWMQPDEQTLLGPQHTVFSGVFQTYLYECTDETHPPSEDLPSLDIYKREEPAAVQTPPPAPPAPAPAKKKAIVYGLPGGPACPPKR